MRRTQAMAVLVGVLGGLLLLVAPAASAQTGYPPGPCTTTSGTVDLGTVNIGARFLLQLAPTCLFTPGTPVTVTVNGVNVPGKVATAGGIVVIDVTVVSATQLSIDDPILVSAVCGRNTATATGASATAQGGVSTQSATFTLTCPIVPAAVPPVATAVPGRLSLTGANVARYGAVALTLIVAGAAFVVLARRRRADSPVPLG